MKHAGRRGKETARRSTVGTRSPLSKLAALIKEQGIEPLTDFAEFDAIWRHERIEEDLLAQVLDHRAARRLISERPATE
jgi:hypothetical protein